MPKSHWVLKRCTPRISKIDPHPKSKRPKISLEKRFQGLGFGSEARDHQQQTLQSLGVRCCTFWAWVGCWTSHAENSSQSSSSHVKGDWRGSKLSSKLSSKATFDAHKSQGFKRHEKIIAIQPDSRICCLRSKAQRDVGGFGEPMPT